jgi:N-acetylgalactosamine-N,N'-diacetylbacillosaminyl-diphospho-undecaprenol 4-alpha-N-acetylgalactosaminyltransferase
LLYPRASKIIVNSLENKYDLAEFLQIPLEKVEVVYNPLNKEKIKMQKKELVDPKILTLIKDKRVFITTGRLVWQKHHEVILEALAGLKNKDRVYLIIGNGPERKKLEELAHQLNIKQQVLFLGQQSNVFKYLAIADLFLYASEVEGFPNVLLEAREMGVPIITSDFKSGAKEVILGEKEYEKIV